MRSRRVPAVLAALVALSLASAHAGAQTSEAIAQARFSKGRDLFLAKSYDAALVEFRAAAELLESPNARLYIARCERELGRYAAAYVDFQRAASEAADRAQTDPRYVTTRDTAKQEGAAVEPKLGRVTILSPTPPSGASITVNGNPVVMAALGVAGPIDPGKVEVVAQANGYVTFKRTVDVGAGEGIEVTIKWEVDPNAKKPDPPVNPPPPPDTGNGSGSGNVTPPPVDGPPVEPPPDRQVKTGGGARTAGFVVGGLGLAGVVAFGVFAGLAQSRFDSLKSTCGGRCDPSYEDKIKGGESLQTGANVALGLGGTFLVVGAILIAIGGPKYVTAPTQTTFVPYLGIDGHGASFGVSRAF